MVWTIWVLEFDSRLGPGIVLFTTASRTALGLTQPPIQWVRGAFSLRVKRPGREADQSPQSSAEVKECVELHLHSSNTLYLSFMSACFNKFCLFSPVYFSSSGTVRSAPSHFIIPYLCPLCWLPHVNFIAVTAL
jgi:hypothetical protein